MAMGGCIFYSQRPEPDEKELKEIPKKDQYGTDNNKDSDSFSTRILRDIGIYRDKNTTINNQTAEKEAFLVKKNR